MTRSLRLLLTFWILALATNASALTARSPYFARRILTVTAVGGFAWLGADDVVGWENGRLVHRTQTSRVVRDYGAPRDYRAYNSFVVVAPNGSEIFVGFTTRDNVDDRIYRVGVAGGA